MPLSPQTHFWLSIKLTPSSFPSPLEQCHGFLLEISKRLPRMCRRSITEVAPRNWGKGFEPPKRTRVCLLGTFKGRPSEKDFWGWRGAADSAKPCCFGECQQRPRCSDGEGHLPKSVAFCEHTFISGFVRLLGFVPPTPLCSDGGCMCRELPQPHPQ